MSDMSPGQFYGRVYRNCTNATTFTYCIRVLNPARCASSALFSKIGVLVQSLEIFERYYIVVYTQATSRVAVHGATTSTLPGDSCGQY